MPNDCRIATFVLGVLLLVACGHEPVRKAAAADSRAVAAQRPAAAVPRASQECLALTLYWEARGEGRTGMLAVGWTVLNRVQSKQFPATPCAVVYQGGEQPPCQFSWWCDGRSDYPRERDSWRAALAVSAELLSDPPRDPTGGALFYHTTSIDSPWKRKRARTATIGQHVFYR